MVEAIVPPWSGALSLRYRVGALKTEMAPNRRMRMARTTKV
jgi:hypothetical protein